MIYSAVNNWIEAKIADFNQPLREDEKLRRSTLALDVNSLPSGLKDRHYTLVLNSAERNTIEAEVYTISAAIKFTFRLYKQPEEYYRTIIDNYLGRLAEKLADDKVSGLPFSSGGVAIYDLNSLSLSLLDRSTGAGEFLQPVIELKLRAAIL